MERSAGNVPRRIIPLRSIELEESLIQKVACCENLIKSIGRTVPAKQMREWIASAEGARALGALKHELSGHMPQQSVDFGRLLRSEIRSIRRYRSWRRERQHGALSGMDIGSLNASLTGLGGSTRSKAVSVHSVDGSVRLSMPDWKDARKRIEEIPGLLAGGSLGGGLLAAVQVLALIYNAHAFLDGNGRLGRLIFNHCLHEAGMPEDSYIPLKTLYSMSQGGFEIRLRQVELQGKWTRLIEYHCDIISAVHQLYSRVPSFGVKDVE